RQATNYGAVCANPMKSQRYLDEIQRMLGMFLQYGIEDNTSDLLPVFSHRLLLVTSAFGSFRICGGKMRKQDMHSISICRASA
ncbi:hypothetical protein, partial [Klebsiella pneumoniae]|uniref:hypothetical protein n=1 Tax=Klebsiella pneumoniae TaxID=573 RepID=UPI003B43CBD3